MMDAVESLGQTDDQAVQEIASERRRFVTGGRLLLESPYIAMIVAAVVGVAFRLPFMYWVVLTPLFAIISVVAGWRNFRTGPGHMQMAWTLALSWFGLMLAIFVLFDSGVQGVMTDNAQSLVMMTLLALGTFTAGVQARVWRFCAVGVLLFIAIPALGWLDQSPLFMMAGIIAVLIVGWLAWWVDQRRARPI